MKRVVLPLLLMLVIQLTASGQPATIRGKVLDSLSQSPVEGADVFLYTKESRKPLFQTRSSSRGFTFSKVPEGGYLLVTAAMGFVSDTLSLNLVKNDTLLLTIHLPPLENILDGVQVTSTPKPITVKGDTISFLADAFTIHPNAILEDILRYLPGVEVDKDGNITQNGERVDKITLNGKDFFIGDIKNANMLPAEMISSLETFKTQSAGARFSGIKEQSNTRTINIKTKKGMEDAWIGNLYASKGQRNSYSAGALFTRLSTNIMVNGNLKMNNINNRFIGTENKNQAPANGIQSIASADLNLMKKWNERFTSTLSLKADDKKTDILQATNRRTFFNDSSLQENRLTHSINSNHTYSVQLMHTYNPNSNNQWQLTTGLSIINSNSNNQDTAGTQTLFNSGPGYTSSRIQSSQQSRQKSFNLNNQLDWRHRFTKTGRTIQFTFAHSVQSGDNPGNLYSLLTSFTPAGSLLQQTAINQQYTQSNTGGSYSGSVLYTEPVFNQHNLSFTYTVNTQFQKNDKKSYDYDSSSSSFHIPNPLTSNQFNNRNTSHRVESSFGKTTQQFNYQLGIGWQYSIQDNNSFTPLRHINQHFINIFPKATANLNLGKGKNLGFNYSGSSTPPVIEQLQPLPDLSNPLFIRSGNPDLKQSFSHNISANFRSLNMKSFNSFSVSVFGDLIQNQIISSTTLLPGGVQEQQFVNINGVYHLGTSTSYSFGIGKKKGGKNNGNLTSRLRYWRDIGLVNGVKNNANGFNWTQIVKLNYNISNKLMTDLTGVSDYSIYRYSISPQQNTRSWNRNATLNLTCMLPLGINVQSSLVWTHLGSSGLLPSQATYIINAAVYKRLFASQQWQLRLSGFDLLNVNRNYTQSAAQNYIYTSQTNQLQRMFLVSLVYDFKIFPNLKK